MRFRRHAFRSGVDSRSVILPLAHSYHDHGMMELLHGVTTTTDGGSSEGADVAKNRLAEEQLLKKIATHVTPKSIPWRLSHCRRSFRLTQSKQHVVISFICIEKARSYANA